MKEKTFNINVPDDFTTDRIDKFLHSKFDDVSRTRLQNLLKDGCVKLNNEVTYDASKKVKTKDSISIVFPAPKETNLKSKKIPLNILYDDNDLAVIDKPAGMVVHPGAGNYDGTLVNALLFHYKDKLSNIGGKLRPGIVHRIDKNTSGILVIAKNDFSHTNLSEQFSNHTIKRTYEALVWGSIKPKNGKISERISRNIKNRQLMAVSKNKGKIAITNYKTLKIFQNLNLPKISLIECNLETGRTHQIRVHMNYKGNPIVGDKSYGKTKKKYKTINKTIEKKINNFGRQALHAKSLGFLHPRNKKNIFFESGRPDDFEMLIKSLEKASI